MPEELQEYKAQVQSACTQGLGDTTPVPALRYPTESIAIFDSLQTLTTWEAASQTVGKNCTTQADVKASEDAWKEQQAVFTKMLYWVQSAVASFAKAKKQLEKDAEARELAEAAKAEKEMQKLRTKNPKTNKGGKGNSEGNIFDLDFQMHPQLLEFENEGDADKPAAEGTFDIPSVWRRCSKVLEVASQAPAKLNMLIFKAGFSRAEEKFQTKSLAKAGHLRNILLTTFGPAAAELVLEDKERTNELFVWARKKGAEIITVEGNGLGSLRACTSERACVVVCLAAMSEVVAALTKDGVIPSMVSIRKFFAEEMKQEVINEWAHTGTVKLYTCCINEGDILCIPPGWLICERTTSSLAMGMAVCWAKRSKTAAKNIQALLSTIPSKVASATGPVADYCGWLKELSAGIAVDESQPQSEARAAASVATSKQGATSSDTAGVEVRAQHGMVSNEDKNKDGAGSLVAEEAKGADDVLALHAEEAGPARQVEQGVLEASLRILDGPVTDQLPTVEKEKAAEASAAEAARSSTLEPQLQPAAGSEDAKADGAVASQPGIDIAASSTPTKLAAAPNGNSAEALGTGGAPAGAAAADKGGKALTKAAAKAAGGRGKGRGGKGGRAGKLNSDLD